MLVLFSMITLIHLKIHLSLLKLFLFFNNNARHLTEITKARVITKLEDGWSIRAVAREFHLNKHTVFKMTKTLGTRGDFTKEGGFWTSQNFKQCRRPHTYYLFGRKSFQNGLVKDSMRKVTSRYSKMLCCHQFFSYFMMITLFINMIIPRSIQLTPLPNG
jgi:hypothetical protein